MRACRPAFRAANTQYRYVSVVVYAHAPVCMSAQPLLYSNSVAWLVSDCALANIPISAHWPYCNSITGEFHDWHKQLRPENLFPLLGATFSVSHGQIIQDYCEMILHYAKENRLVRLGSFIFRAFLNADVFGCVLLFSNGNGRDLLGHLWT